MTGPQFTPSDADFCASMQISLDCPQCAASRSLQVFYAMKHDEHIATINLQSSRLIAADEQQQKAEAEHQGQLHIWRLVAFAGWFVVGLGLIAGWWK